MQHFVGVIEYSVFFGGEIALHMQYRPSVFALGDWWTWGIQGEAAAYVQ